MLNQPTREAMMMNSRESPSICSTRKKINMRKNNIRKDWQEGGKNNLRPSSKPTSKKEKDMKTKCITIFSQESAKWKNPKLEYRPILTWREVSQLKFQIKNKPCRINRIRPKPSIGIIQSGNHQNITWVIPKCRNIKWPKTTKKDSPLITLSAMSIKVLGK